MQKQIVKYVKTIMKECPMCGQDHYMRLTEKQAKQWASYVCYGGLVQEKMPDIDKFGREFINSGYCPSCQESLFGSKLDNKSAYFSWENPEELNYERTQKFVKDAESLDYKDAILSEAANKLSIADKVLYLYEMELEDEYYVDENGKVLKREGVLSNEENS